MCGGCDRRKTLLNNAFLRWNLMRKRNETKKKEKKENDTRWPATTAQHKISTKIGWLKALHCGFDWWHQIIFTVHRRQNEEIEFRDTACCAHRDFNSLLLVERSYSCGVNLINAFLILFNEFDVRSALFTLILFSNWIKWRSHHEFN